MSKAGTEKRKSFGLKALRHRMFGNKARKQEGKPDVLSDDEANPRSNSDDLSKALSPANRSQSHELLAGDGDNNQQNHNRDDNRENETGERKTSPVQSRIERLKNELSKQQQQRPISSHHSPPGGRKSPKIKRLSHLPPAGLDQMLMKKGPPPVMGKKPATSKPMCDEVKHVEENKPEEPTNPPSKKDEIEKEECKPAQTNAATDPDVTTTTATTTNPHNVAISRIAVRPKNRRAVTRKGAKRQKIVTKDEDVDDFFAISSEVKAVTLPLDPAPINESLDEQPSTNKDLLTTIEEVPTPEVKCEETNNQEEEKPEQAVVAEVETEKVDEIQKPTSISRSSSKNSETEVSAAELLSKDDQDSTQSQSNGIVEDTKEEVSTPVEKAEDHADTQPPPVVNTEDYKLKRDLSKIFEMTWNENREESPTKSKSGSKSSLSDLSEKNSPVKASPMPVIKTVDVEETIEEETKDKMVPPEQEMKKEENQSPKPTEISTDLEPSHKKNFLKLRMKKVTDPDRRKSSGSCLTPDAKDPDVPRFSLSIDNLKSFQGPSSPTSLFPVRLKKTGRNLSDSGAHEESKSTRSASKTSLEATSEPQSKSSVFRSPKKLFSHNKKRSTGEENTNNNNISWRTDSQQNSQQEQQVASSPAAGGHNNSNDDVSANNRFKNHTSSSVTSIWERDVLSVQNVPVIRENTTTTLPLNKNNQQATTDEVDGHKTTTVAQRVKPAAVVLKPPHPTVVVEKKKDEPSSPKVPLVTLRRLKNRSNHKHGGETKSDVPEWIAKAKRHSVTWEGKLDAQQQKEKKPLSSTKSEDYPRENSSVNKRLSVPVVKLAEDIFELKRANEGTPAPPTTVNVNQRPALKPISPIKTTVKEQSITTNQESDTKKQTSLTPTSPSNSKSTVPTWMEMALKKQKDWKEAKFV